MLLFGTVFLFVIWANSSFHFCTFIILRLDRFMHDYNEDMEDC